MVIISAEQLSNLFILSSANLTGDWLLEAGNWFSALIGTIEELYTTVRQYYSTVQRQCLHSLKRYRTLNHLVSYRFYTTLLPNNLVYSLDLGKLRLRLKDWATRSDFFVTIKSGSGYIIV